MLSAGRAQTYYQYWIVQYKKSQRVPRPYFESIVLDGLNDIAEEDLGGESVAMINDGLWVRAIPAIQFHTAAAFGEGSGNKEGTWLGSNPSAPSQNEGGSGTGICLGRLMGSLGCKGEKRSLEKWESRYRKDEIRRGQAQQTELKVEQGKQWDLRKEAVKVQGKNYPKKKT